MRRIGLVASGLLVLSTAHAAGLDATFGSGGRLLPNAGATGSSQANGAILQSDGKIVIVGTSPAAVTSLEQGVVAPMPPDPTRDFLVVRLNSDGSLDTGFGSSGAVRIDFNHGDDRAQAVAQQSDGKLILVGAATSMRGDFDLAVVRLLPDGDLDPSFGVAGKVTVNIPGDPNAPDPTGSFGFVPAYPPDTAYSVVIQHDGRLLIGGNSEQCAIAACPTLTRLTADGAVDTTFGPTNTGTIVLRSAFGSIYSTVIEPTGAILVTSAIGPFEIDAAGHSATFAGPPFSGPPGLMSVFALALQPDGRVIFGGAKNVDEPEGTTVFHWMVSRTQTPAVADSTFGSGGTAIGPEGLFEQYLTSITLEGGGKILAGGVISSGSDELSRQDAMILRLQDNGAPDVNFGSQGVLRADFSEGSAQYSYRQAALLRQSDGKLLMVGNRGILSGGGDYYPTLEQSSEQIALARFNSTPEYALASNATTVSNTSASVTIEVKRTGASTDPVSVSYTTNDGTAVAGTDYTATSGKLTWLPTDADSKSITVPINNNGLSTGSRAFAVVLSNPTEGSIASSSATVAIQDNAPAASTGSPGIGGTGSSGGGGSLDWLLLAALGTAALRKRAQKAGVLSQSAARDSLAEGRQHCNFPGWHGLDG